MKINCIGCKFASFPKYEIGEKVMYFKKTEAIVEGIKFFIDDGWMYKINKSIFWHSPSAFEKIK